MADNVIYAVTDIERPDNEQRDRAIKGVRVDLLLKADSVTGLPIDGSFLPGSTAWHPNSGKRYILNADGSAWVLIAGSTENLPTPAGAADAGKILTVNSTGTGYELKTAST